MDTRVRTVLDEALRLSEPDRAALVDALLESLEPAADAQVETAWRAEIRRRIEEVESGEVETVPWPEVRERLFAKLRAR